MEALIKSLGIDRIKVEERLALVEELWDSIAAEGRELPLTDSQRTELDRRIAEQETSPGDVVPWFDIQASITECLKA